MTPIIDYLENEKLLNNPKKAGKLKRKIALYYIFQREQYKKELYKTLLKCVTRKEQNASLQISMKDIVDHMLGVECLQEKS